MTIDWTGVSDPVQSTAPAKVETARRGPRSVFDTMTGNMSADEIHGAYLSWFYAESTKTKAITIESAFTAGIRFCEDYHMKKAQQL